MWTLALFAVGCLCLHELYELLRARQAGAARRLPRARRPARGGAATATQFHILLAAVGCGAGAVRADGVGPEPRARLARDGDDAVRRLLDRLRARARGAAARAAARRRDRDRRARRHVHRRHRRVLRRARVRPPPARAAHLAEQDGRGARRSGCSPRSPACVVAGLYQDWLSTTDALLLGLGVAIAAPIGDLFESFVKRDVGVKDTGAAFGAHGGALDRVDAALFAAVVGYYVWYALAA